MVVLGGVAIYYERGTPVQPYGGSWLWGGHSFQDHNAVSYLQGLLENKVHHAVGAYGRPTSMRLGTPNERCGRESSLLITYWSESIISS